MRPLFYITLFTCTLHAQGQDTAQNELSDSEKAELTHYIKSLNTDSILASWNDETVFITTSLPPCPYTLDNATQDIAKDSLTLVISCGIVGCPEIDQEKRNEFEKKYNLTFDYVGCIRWWDNKDEDIHGYNQTIFQHLREKYGKVVDQEYRALFIEKAEQ